MASAAKEGGQEEVVEPGEDAISPSTGSDAPPEEGEQEEAEEKDEGTASAAFPRHLLPTLLPVPVTSPAPSLPPCFVSFHQQPWCSCHAPSSQATQGGRNRIRRSRVSSLQRSALGRSWEAAQPLSVVLA